MKELLASLKSDLKVLAASIRTAKQSRKTQPNGYVSGLADLQFDFRVKHIFRCLLRGKTLEEIENSRLEKPPVPHSSPEVSLHWKISHLYNTYTDMRYDHKIQCSCQKCFDKRGWGNEQDKQAEQAKQALCVNS